MADLRSNRLLRSLGIILGIGGILFVAERLVSYRAQLDLGAIGLAGYLCLLLLAAIYAIASALLALGWREVLAHLGVKQPFRWALWVYAVSLLAKYLPGNMFQFIGRQALGAASGINHAALLKSSLVELGLIAACACMLVPLLVNVAWPAAHGLVGPIIAVGLLLVALLLARRYGTPHLARAVGSYLTFLILSATIFAAVLIVVGGRIAPADLSFVVGAYTLAWLAGFVTPGAPAGLGVREAVLLFLLAGLAAPPVILLGVVTSRAVTVIGDLGFYAFGGIFGKYETSPV